jgi:hypothetical protein
MALVAVVVGTDRGMKMLMNYFFGLIAFKSIDIGLVVVHNLSNYYAADKVGELYYGMGQNLFNVLNTPYYVGDIAQSAGLAGLLGIAAVFITPIVVFYGESKAAIGLIGAVKGMYAGTNPDAAAGATNALQGNLEYQAEKNSIEDSLRKQGESDRAISHIMQKLGMGFDSAETAKLYGQMQSEIESINRGARAEVAYNPITGETLTNIDSSQRFKDGKTWEGQIKSLISDGILEGIGGAKELGGLLTVGGIGTWVGKKVKDYVADKVLDSIEKKEQKKSRAPHKKR